MDWLGHRQDAIEAGLARRHLAPAVNPSKMALFDLSSSWLEGPRCPLAARGYSRDGKKGKLQIEYGLLTDPEGRPVAVRVFPGNTGDPAAFTAIVDVVRKKFGLQEMVMVGDRGMITSARIDALNQAGRRDPEPDPYGWITALRAPAIRKLMADDGPLQLQPVRPAGPRRDHLAGLPRRAADRLPQPGPGRRPRPHPRGPAGRHREAARPLIARVQAGPAAGAGPIGVEVGKVISSLQDRQALRRHHHRYHPGHRPPAGPDRRRSRPGRVLRAPHPRPRRRARRGRRGHRLQEPQIRGTGLPAHQIRRPGPAARLPPAGGTRQGPRADLHARLLPDLAPAPRLGPADLHRPGPARAGQPGHPGPPRPRPPRPRPPASTTRPGSPTAASAACSSTWPP